MNRQVGNRMGSKYLVRGENTVGGSEQHRCLDVSWCKGGKSHGEFRQKSRNTLGPLHHGPIRYVKSRGEYGGCLIGYEPTIDPTRRIEWLGK